MRRRTRGTAFTLVELLVVMSVIGLLTALLLPAILYVMESSRRLQCTNNLKQMGLAIKLYYSGYGLFPTSWINGDAKSTWAKSLLPYLDQQALWEKFDRSLALNAGTNAEVSATPVPTFLCPTSPSPPVYLYDQGDDAGLYATIDYKGCQSVNASDPLLTGWGQKNWIPGIISRWPVREADVVDGLSKTFLIVESVGGLTIYGPDKQPYSRIPQIWYASDGSWIGRAMSGMSPGNFAITFKRTICGVNCTNMYDYGPYSFHPGGANCLLADGRAIFVDENVDPVIVSAMYSYADRQPITQP